MNVMNIDTSREIVLNSRKGTRKEKKEVRPMSEEVEELLENKSKEEVKDLYY